MNKKLIFFFLLVLNINIVGAQSTKIYPPKNKIYHKGWIDFNKNGKKDVYEDPTQPVEKRIADLLGQMTMEEKSNQLATYYGYKKCLKDSLPTAE